MIPNPHQRWFKISEVQITALRKGWTHTSITDKKGILQTVSEDQMIDCGCTSHRSFQSERVGVLKLIEENCRVLHIALERVESLTERATKKGIPVFNHGQFASLVNSVIEMNEKELLQKEEH
jgi:hypothetical protein